MLVKKVELIWKRMKKKHVFCQNEKGENLGYLKHERDGRYLHWCWHQYDGIKMNLKYLQNVTKKQKELFREVQLAKNRYLEK